MTENTHSTKTVAPASKQAPVTAAHKTPDPEPAEGLYLPLSAEGSPTGSAVTKRPENAPYISVQKIDPNDDSVEIDNLMTLTGAEIQEDGMYNAESPPSFKATEPVAAPKQPNLKEK